MDFHEHVFRKVRNMHLSGAGGERCVFEYLNKNISWKSQIKHEAKSDVYLDIADGVRLCNNILIFQGSPPNRHTYHPTLSESMHKIDSEFPEIAFSVMEIIARLCPSENVFARYSNLPTYT